MFSGNIELIDSRFAVSSRTFVRDVHSRLHYLLITSNSLVPMLFWEFR